MNLRVESLADHVDLVETIGRWHWEEWGQADPDGSLTSWTEALRRKAERDAIPTTVVAFDGDVPVGSVTLVAHDMPDRRDLAHLTPWVAGTYVEPSARGRGVGTALMLQAEREARRLGVSRLYLYTGPATAAGFYEPLGWSRVDETPYEGEDVVIMALDL